MPQHAVSTSQGQIEGRNAADAPDITEMPQEALTCSPPIAGNDISADIEGKEPDLFAKAEAASETGSSEEARDGSNDNLPLGALVVAATPAHIIASEPTRGRLTKTVAAVGALALLGLGAGVFAYSGSGEQKKIAPLRTELAAIPNSAPDASTSASLSSASEKNTGSIAALPAAPEPAPAAPAAVQPEPALPAAALPPPANAEERAAAPPAAAPPQRAAAVASAQPIAGPVTAPPARAPETSRTAAIPNPPPPQNGSPFADTPPRPPIGLPPSAVAGPARGQIVFVQRPGVNIRNAPSQSGQIVGAAQMGGQFMVAGRDGEWVQVQQGPWRGWINQRFLGPRLPRG